MCHFKVLLQKEVTDLKKETSTAKVMQLSQANNKQVISAPSVAQVSRFVIICTYPIKNLYLFSQLHLILRKR